MSAMTAGPERRAAAGLQSIVVLLPVYDDWPSARLLIPRIVESVRPLALHVTILIVDDGSSVQPDPGAFAQEVTTAAPLRILRLHRNVGHQRAIAIGLCHVYEHLPCDAIVVMDADGEDNPDDIPRLLGRFTAERQTAIVFAERRRRAESWTFRVFYHLYRSVHYLLTGMAVRVGNFSVVPYRRLTSLMVVSELWVHYAAAVFRSRQPRVLVPTERSRRLEGRSRMNFVALVVHGLSAISVYSDVVFTRLVVAAGVLAAVTVALTAVTIGIRSFTTLAVPGWATFVVGLLFLVLLQSIMFVVAMTFVVLGARQQMTFLPRRDYGYYVAEVVDVVAAGEAVR